MRIVCVSSLYPPSYEGGYELLCAETMEGLVRSGAEVTVLTSGYAGARETYLRNGVTVLPVLERMEGCEAEDVVARNGRNEAAVSAALVDTDCVMLWSLGQLDLSPVVAARKSGLPFCFVVADYRLFGLWRASIEEVLPNETGWYELVETGEVRVGAALGSLQRSDFDSAVFVSEYLRGVYGEIGIGGDGSAVLYAGVEPRRVSSAVTRDAQSLFFAGRLVPSKGTHLVVEALGLLHHEYGLTDSRLTIAGWGSSEYEGELKQQIDRLGLAGSVDFVGKMSPEQVRQLMARHSVVVAPSIWQDPAPLVPLEAMAEGTPVVTTSVGGNPERLRDGVDADVVAPVPAELAARAAALLTDPELWSARSLHGISFVESQFTSTLFIGNLAHHLEGLRRAHIG
jgi:glycosyltransferase involved in cell wall biosynthesis